MSTTFRTPPNELWVIIFTHSTKSLYSLSLTSKLFHSLSNPLLYKRISLNKVGSIFSLLDTLLKRSRGRKYASWITELSITITKNWTNGAVFKESFSFIKKLLVMDELKGLKSLTVDVDLVHISSDILIPLTASFKLNTFSSDLYCDENMFQFLVSQSSIRKLTLGGTFSPSFADLIHTPSSTPLLPNLTTLDADPNLAAPLIHDRPVSNLQLPLMELESYVLDSMKYSSAPGGITQLVLLLPRVKNPNKLIDMIADSTPGLVQLSIYFGIGCVFDQVRTPLHFSLTKYLKPRRTHFKHYQYLSPDSNHSKSSFSPLQLQHTPVLVLVHPLHPHPIQSQQHSITHPQNERL